MCASIARSTLHFSVSQRDRTPRPWVSDRKATVARSIVNGACIVVLSKAMNWEGIRDDKIEANYRKRNVSNTNLKRKRSYVINSVFYIATPRFLCACGNKALDL